MNNLCAPSIDTSHAPVDSALEPGSHAPSLKNDVSKPSAPLHPANRQIIKILSATDSVIPEVVAPRYVESFSCIGPDCSDHCCSTWAAIPIDQKTLSIWEKISLPGQTTPLAEATVARHGVNSNEEYSRQMRVETESNACTLMTKDKLCSVHSAFGEELIPISCRYPRRRIEAGKQVSMYLSPGCPEVARLALEQHDALELVSMRNYVETGPLPTSRRNTLGKASEEDLANASVDAVEACAELLAEVARCWIGLPGLSAWQAWSFYMAAVGSVLDATELAQDKAKTAEMFVALHQTVPNIDELTLAVSDIEQQGLESWPMKERLVMAIKVARRVESRPGHSKNKQILSSAIAALGLSDSDSSPITDDACATFMQSASEWLEPFDSKNRHLVKNFLLNRLGLVNFPSGGASKLISELNQTRVHLEMIRIFLVGVAASKGPDFGAADYVAVIQAYSRYAL